LNKLEQIKFENKLCHGDFHIFNLIQTSHDIKIIDWVCSSSGNPEADIYRTYLLYKLYKDNIADIYMDIYCQMMKMDKKEIMSWSPIIAGARLGEYVKDEREENILLEIINHQKIDLHQ